LRSLFCVKKNQESHTKELHGRATGSRKVKPKRMLAKRKGETLCVVEDSVGGKDVEWLREEDVDETGLAQPDDTESSRIPIVENLDTWLANPWTQE